MRHPALLCFSIGACAPSADIALTTNADTLSIIVITDPDGTPGIVAHEDLSGPIRVSAEVTYLLEYQRALASIGFEPGPLTLQESGIPVVAPDRITRIDAGGSTHPRGLPGAIAALRLRARDPCATFIAEHDQPDPETNDSARLVVDVEHGALVASSSGRWYLVGETDTTELDLQQGLHRGAGVYDSVNDEVWLLAANGSVSRGHWERGFEPAPSFPEPGLRIYASGGGDPFELVVMTSSGAVQLFDGTTWRVRAPGDLSLAVTGTRIAWLGPDSVVATGSGMQEIRRVERGVASVESPAIFSQTLAETDFFMNLKNLPGWGPVLGTERGVLGRMVDGDWEAIQPDSKTQVRALESYRSGVVYGGEDGVLNQIYPEEICPAEGHALYNDVGIGHLVEAQDTLIGVLQTWQHPLTFVRIREK